MGCNKLSLAAEGLSHLCACAGAPKSYKYHKNCLWSEKEDQLFFGAIEGGEVYCSVSELCKTIATRLPGKSDEQVGFLQPADMYQRQNFCGLPGKGGGPWSDDVPLCCFCLQVKQRYYRAVHRGQIQNPPACIVRARKPAAPRKSRRATSQVGFSSELKFPPVHPSEQEIGSRLFLTC